MSRLPTVRPVELVRLLKRAGFEEKFQKGSHLYLWQPVTDRTTSVPIHQKDLRRGLFKKILKQAGLSEADFRRLL